VCIENNVLEKRVCSSRLL